MGKSSFIMYTEYLEHIGLLSMDQRGVLFTAVLNYASGKQLPEMDGMVQMAFSFIKARMERDSESYQKTIEARREAGRLGGLAKQANATFAKQDLANASKAKQTVANLADNDNEYDTDNDKDNINNVQKAHELFERLWKMYPNKKGKGQVSDTQKKRLLAIGESTLVKAIERYSLELQKDADWRKPQNGSTFFNSGYVDYLDGNYEPGKSERNKSTSQNRFNNFNQREYDYDALEKQLLSSQN